MPWLLMLAIAFLALWVVATALGWVLGAALHLLWVVALILLIIWILQKLGGGDSTPPV